MTQLFQSTLPVGGATRVCHGYRRVKVFQSTLPVGGATTDSTAAASVQGFQSTLPVGGATFHICHFATSEGISIHAPRGGSDHDFLRLDMVGRISIHAPRGGSDREQRPEGYAPVNFNPRSPWGERLVLPVLQHQSVRYFNPRSPWGERLPPQPFICATWTFQSTLPVGGATLGYENLPDSARNFNPRSPWGERPHWPTSTILRSSYFNPRSPWGERLRLIDADALYFAFQSTLPVGGAT